MADDIPISTASKICKQNYKSNCGSCPIRPACVNRIKPGWDGHRQWCVALEELARKVSGDGD